MATDGDRQPLDPELLEAVKSLVREAREHFVRHRDAGHYIPIHTDWQKLDYFDTGFPRVTRDFDAKVPNYSRPFGLAQGEWTPIGYGDWESFRTLVEYVKGHERIMKYLGADAPPADVDEEIRTSFFLIGVGLIFLRVFERVMHLNGEDFAESDITPIYCEVEMSLLSEKLPIYIVVPIALTHFEASERRTSAPCITGGRCARYELAQPTGKTNTCAYPDRFERWGWLQAREPIHESQIAQVRGLYHTLAAGSNASLPLAASRVSTAMLRDNERDAILDLIIGLEALAGDQATTEVTHKLALRAAAVLARLDPEGAQPEEVFRAVKSLYGYRSAVAHGNVKEMSKKENVKLRGGSEVDAVQLAASYLRRVIRALAVRPDLTGGREIDEAILLPALNPGRPEGADESEPEAR